MALDTQREKAMLPIKGELSLCLDIQVTTDPRSPRRRFPRSPRRRSKESKEESSKESKEKTSRKLKIEDPISYSKLLASVIGLEIRVVGSGTRPLYFLHTLGCN
ncbi:hypothetical protein MA16_Dca013655 [Dendrobium catenatum]|uniref:Uncharacterized protein n=1 Tax=Dendrobium catenatum TaxID=906689 RepID=A0A2I0WB25_9ASPA|nr:hypothetical protein MA16_Dca013655 [Dendrobium catenatum]